MGRIRDTCSQLTWKSHSLHTHGGTFSRTLTPAQTLYLHESCQNKPKSEVCKTVTSPFDICVASSSVVFVIHAASWHEIYTYTHHFNSYFPDEPGLASFHWCFFSICSEHVHPFGTSPNFCCPWHHHTSTKSSWDISSALFHPSVISASSSEHFCCTYCIMKLGTDAWDQM